MVAPQHSKLATPLTALCLGFVLLLSYFTYFHRFAEPAGFFWDENYHVAAAEKYLNRVFFMEQHPPLGKLLIAAGEWLLNVSENDQQFLTTDYASGDFHDGFAIAGYRFLPALLSWLTAPLFFLILLLITRSPISATLLSFFYIFENALIVHGRGAMLEGSLLFFAAVTILFFLLLTEKRSSRTVFLFSSFLFGISCGLAFTTKLVGLILILLVPMVCLRLKKDWRRSLLFLFVSTAGFVIAFVTVWQIHFSLGKVIQPALSNAGWFGASQEYQTMVNNGKHASLLSFPVMIRDSVKYTKTFTVGVPRLDLCKPNENGSPFFYWPFGARAINYRWASVGSDTYRYLYLQVNPVTWGMGFVGIFFALMATLSPLLLPLRQKLKDPFLLWTFLILYFCYMLAISQLDRVMYLYHYFLPLLFSFTLFGIVFTEIGHIGKYALSEERKTLCLMLLASCTFLSYQFYRPLSYYEPISNAALERRALFPLWELTCVQCEKKSPVAVPRTCK